MPLLLNCSGKTSAVTRNGNGDNDNEFEATYKAVKPIDSGCLYTNVTVIPIEQMIIPEIPSNKARRRGKHLMKTHTIPTASKLKTARTKLPVREPSNPAREKIPEE